MVNAMRFTKDLEESGFTKDQANTTVKVLLEIMESKFATKQDIEVSETTLRSEMHRMEAAIRADMQKMEASIRSDMQAMEASIRSDMQKMEASIRSDMKELAYAIRELRIELKASQDRIVIRLSGAMVIMFSTMLAIQKFHLI